ncbi:MAG: hypothetical protein BWX86_02568 [Verrucomicrobia bacterium ADurb.Bin122]|nr:MAG: hypothetical protein BWX86_02568 [Verrucomicrobia bacterium ADurb.Bin122]
MGLEARGARALHFPPDLRRLAEPVRETRGPLRRGGQTDPHARAVPRGARDRRHRLPHRRPHRHQPRLRQRRPAAPRRRHPLRPRYAPRGGPHRLPAGRAHRLHGQPPRNLVRVSPSAHRRARGGETPRAPPRTGTGRRHRRRARAVARARPRRAEDRRGGLPAQPHRQRPAADQDRRRRHLGRAEGGLRVSRVATRGPAQRARQQVHRPHRRPRHR